MAECRAGVQSFPVHVASTVAERAKGFAGAPPTLIDHTAILFLYPARATAVSRGHFYFGEGPDSPPSTSVSGYFNMRHMQAPLDIAFMDRDGLILAVLHMAPGPRLYRPDESYAAALELAAGRAAELKLVPGSRLTCSNRSPGSAR